MQSIQIRRTRHRLLPDARRVLAKPYLPGDDAALPGVSRANLLMARVLAIPDADIEALNAEIARLFEARHRDLMRTFERNFEAVAHHVPDTASISVERRLLIGAYFTHEYSTEGAALFNPSIVPAPDQSGLPSGAKRFVMSLRAIGEGHLSSIEFRSGVLLASGDISLDEPRACLVAGTRAAPSHFDKSRFSVKLQELGANNDLSARVLNRLGDRFTLDELEASLVAREANGPAPAIWFETAKIIRVLASSNYVTTFPTSSHLSERVIFPAGPNETRGMEDARFVQFTDSDRSKRYYATYTAYDGFSILPQLIETDDFVRFTISTLNGAAAQNKGMALFPRRIGGKYVMLSRRDRENLHLSTSNDVHLWDDLTELYRPQAPWELLQVGNCGSPIETPAGWLVLTHGVGPMRRYAIGALLLDLEHPERVIGRLSAPLLEPDESEREGYVPNVLYTCGALAHGGELVVPYGFSDSGVAFAQVPMADLLRTLLRPASTQL
jgi:predicted GH43/DUF377 family glycosyl hydrolase